MLDIFDCKQRMRQGTFNLFLWQNKKLDMSIDCTTPGLFYDKPENLGFGGEEQAIPAGDGEDEEAQKKSMDNFKEINQLLQRINFYHKRPKQDDWKEWIDRHSHEAIF